MSDKKGNAMDFYYYKEMWAWDHMVKMWLGPVDIEYLRYLAQRGDINPKTLVQTVAGKCLYASEIEGVDFPKNAQAKKKFRTIYWNVLFGIFMSCLTFGVAFTFDSDNVELFNLVCFITACSFFLLIISMFIKPLMP